MWLASVGSEPVMGPPLSSGMWLKVPSRGLSESREFVPQKPPCRCRKGTSGFWGNWKRSFGTLGWDETQRRCPLLVLPVISGVQMRALTCGLAYARASASVWVLRMDLPPYDWSVVPQGFRSCAPLPFASRSSSFLPFLRVALLCGAVEAAGGCRLLKDACVCVCVEGGLAESLPPSARRRFVWHSDWGLPVFWEAKPEKPRPGRGKGCPPSC